MEMVTTACFLLSISNKCLPTALLTTMTDPGVPSHLAMTTIGNGEIAFTMRAVAQVNLCMNFVFPISV